MSKESRSTRTILAGHSRAKVELLEQYFRIYLNILQRVPYIDMIHYYDLCAGEGVYEDDSKGSSVVAAKAIKDHYYANGEECISIEAAFNDSGMSEIEKGLKKIERVENAISKLYRPSSVSYSFSSLDYADALIPIKKQVSELKNNERALIFIDPWGYKNIHPNDLINLMANGKTEVLLFLPVSFMYRFAEKSLSDDDFPGGHALRSFLEELFDSGKPNTESVIKFIDSMTAKFRLMEHCTYVDRFMLKTEDNNLYCLFFFTCNIVGLEKMIDVKWKMDGDLGQGFNITDGEPSLFQWEDTSPFPKILMDEIEKRDGMTNVEIKEFGLLNYHPVTHCKQILTKNKKRIMVESLDLKPVKGFYLNDANRTVKIKMNKDG